MGAAVDMSALTGLRGLAALWIMIFHCLIFSDVHLNLQGSSLMPLFFLLSGFAAAVTYGGGERHRLPFRWCCCKGDPESGDDEPLPAFRTGRFLRNRAARVLPLYYVCTALAAPLCLMGWGELNPHDHGAFIGSVVVSVLPVSTWFYFLIGIPFDAPAWTISTLWFFWLLFPFVLPCLQRLSDAKLGTRIIQCFWAQIALMAVLTLGCSAVEELRPLAFYVATFTPLSRLPVFLMGAAAGVLCARNAEESADADDPLTAGRTAVPSSPSPRATAASGQRADMAYRSVMSGPLATSSPLSWPSYWWCPRGSTGWLSCCTITDGTTHVLESVSVDVEARRWARVADLTALQLVLGFAGVIAADTVNRKVAGGDGIHGGLWFQAVVAYPMLTLVVGLCRDGGRSRAGRALRSAPAQLFGGLSMSVYLVHWIVLRGFAAALHGARPLRWPPVDCWKLGPGPDQDACLAQMAVVYKFQTIPAWGSLVVAVVSIAVAFALNRCVEQPARAVLKARPPKEYAELASCEVHGDECDDGGGAADDDDDADDDGGGHRQSGGPS